MGEVALSQLTRFAQACRSGLESLSHKPHSMFCGFPIGSCGPASELVGRHLKERLGLDGAYISGWDFQAEAAGQSHAWFEVQGCIIDITHDQFSNTGVQSWVVPKSSPWHRSFVEIDVRPGFVVPSGWPNYPHDGYKAIADALDRLGL